MGACTSMLEEREIENVNDVQDAKHEKKESEVGMENEQIRALNKYHREIEANYKVMAESDKEISDHVDALIPFTGYYAIMTSPGSYFMIDTNIHIANGSQTPYYNVTLILSIDGKKPTRYKFCGTFVNGRLKQTTGLNVDLLFERPDLNTSNGVVAKFTGSISNMAVEGSTFNNPTSYNTYIGKYYLETKNDEEPVLVMEVLPKFQISYDYGSNDGILDKVDGFTFNLNMWYFSFSGRSQYVSLIMGVGSGQGLACNDLTDFTSTRNLYAIPKPNIDDGGLPNVNSMLLAKFSGYYQIRTIGVSESAFVSIEGLYKLSSSGKLWIVCIGVSSDGKTSKQYIFDTTMTFDNNILITPDLKLTFTRKFNPENRSLVSVEGSFLGYEGTKGYNLYNPIPLSAFGGVPLKSKGGMDTLVINSDDEVTFNGKVMDKFTYIPLMFMFFAEDGTTMSFGSEAMHGNMCMLYETIKMKKANYLFAIN